MLFEEKEIDEKKRTLVIVIVTALVIVAACILLYCAMRMGNLNEEDYPPSTLEKMKFASAYTKDERLSDTLSCPTLPYLIDVMEGTIVTADGDVCYSGGSYYFVMRECGAMEKTEEILCSMTLTDQKYAETPKVSFDPVITDKGYANGYAAYYLAGHVLISTRLSNYHRYGALYRIVTGTDTDLMLYVCSDNLEKLCKHKELLDAVVFTITVDPARVDLEENRETMTQVPASMEDIELIDVIEQIDTENIDDKETLKEGKTINHAISEDGLTEDIEYMELPDGSYGTVTKDLNGIETYEKNKPFEVTEHYHNMCVNYYWENQATPLSVTLLDPNGKEYAPSEEDSGLNWRVFIVKDNPVGSYVLRVKTRDTLMNTGLDVMELKNFYLSNGLPVKENDPS